MSLYDEQVWVNGVGGGTPLNEDRLNHMEEGIAAAADAAYASFITVGTEAPEDPFVGQLWIDTN